MKTMTRKIIGIVQAGLLCFLTCGICTADELNGIGEAIPIAPFGAIDITTPTFEWTSVPGATMYCLLVEDIEGVPLYLAWYTDEEAGCMLDEESCSVTPPNVVDGDVWYVLPCSDEECGQWSQSLSFGCISSYAGDYVGIMDPECIKKCSNQHSNCISGCLKVQTRQPRLFCTKVCNNARNQCTGQCPHHRIPPEPVPPIPTPESR